MGADMADDVIFRAEWRERRPETASGPWLQVHPGQLAITCGCGARVEMTRASSGSWEARHRGNLLTFEALDGGIPPHWLQALRDWLVEEHDEPY